MNKIKKKIYTAYTTANLVTTCNFFEAIRRRNECTVRSLDDRAAKWRLWANVTRATIG